MRSSSEGAFGSCWNRITGPCPPDVYPFAAHLARRLGSSHVIALGGASAQQRAACEPDVRLIDTAPHVPHISEEALSRSVIVCANVLERLPDPGECLGTLARLAQSGAAVVICTASRSRFDELERILASVHQRVHLRGLTANGPADPARETIVGVCGKDDPLAVGPAPRQFRVLAIMTAYNEEDIVGFSVGALLAEGVEVHLIDNWSTDRTLERARAVGHLGRFSWERFPPDAPDPTWRWSALLDRVDEVAAASHADWCIHHDADERRSAPWPGVSLRDALHVVRQRGFNAVDHTLLNFWPVDDGYRSGHDPERHFRHFSFGDLAGHFVQIKAWKNQGETVRLAASGGHSVEIRDRRVFPYNFLIKHYPIRSQAQGERKVFRDRVPRWDPGERARGWHVQYDGITTGHRFIRSPRELHVFDDTFQGMWFVERLTHLRSRL